MRPADRLPATLPDYFPPASGRYEVRPGLLRFGKPLGGGTADGHVFQLDSTFPRYRAAKRSARAERLGKYVQTHDLTPAVEEAVARFTIDRLTREHPEHFHFAQGELACVLTGDRLVFDDRLALRRAASPCETADPPYASAFDALAAQVQEDLAVVSTEGDPPRRHWLSAVHLCFPNHWAAEDKVGHAFPAVHEPVAGMERMNRQADHLVRVMIGAAEGLVRFAWGVTFDDELNHHPAPPPGAAPPAGFDPAHPCAFLRVERQTIWGFPQVGAALFTIRPYLYDVAQIRRDPARRANLFSAIKSMSAASLAYKGLAASRGALLAWLDETPG